MFYLIYIFVLAPEEEHENEEVLIEWFKLVNNRNKLIRKEGEFIAQ